MFSNGTLREKIWEIRIGSLQPSEVVWSLAWFGDWMLMVEVHSEER